MGFLFFVVFSNFWVRLFRGPRFCYGLNSEEKKVVAPTRIELISNV